jgi:hypothetical protein
LFPKKSKQSVYWFITIAYKACVFLVFAFVQLIAVTVFKSRVIQTSRLWEVWRGI